MYRIHNIIKQSAFMLWTLKDAQTLRKETQIETELLTSHDYIHMNHNYLVNVMSYWYIIFHILPPPQKK